ncbi:putative olfactory receptor 10J6 [Antechinus flavipes]|uniref:putative olfactory receptor 10J6 n=1 Tax=Antechinus flavipes TaxID=38775 RepID=UPI002235498F|nr:putative olfactory receptor 10J6 [Antechinus flavipes]
MRRHNRTEVSEFFFQGFSSFQEHQITLFVVFLALYIFTLAGNVIIVIIIRIDSHLHTPMYFFLSMLSTSETLYSLVIIPRMLSSLVSRDMSISLADCATQMFFFVTFGINNCFLLTAMGYDRYVAICNPLRYTVIMNRKVCVLLVWMAFSIGLIVAVTQVTSVFRLPFCGDFSMQKKNYTQVTMFTFQGFSSFHEHQITLFAVFLILYIITLASNVIIVTVICFDRHLHTPMYFFLSILSTSETLYTLVIIPRMLSSLIGWNQSISLEGCATQMFFFVTLAINNCFLLTVMGYDRYVAICNPLRYMIVMNKKVCAYLVCGAFAIGLTMASVQVTSIFSLPFCEAEVAHFYCDILPMMKLACIDTTINEIINFVVSLGVILVPMGLVFISYILIISAILKIASSEGRKKTFATCASHLTVVIVHYGCASIAYLKPKSENSMEQDRLLSITYTLITPLLNPVVYSLRNKEVKDALRRAIGKKLP